MVDEMQKHSRKSDTRKNYMDMLVVHTPKLHWHVLENGMVEISMVHRGFYDRIAQQIFHKPRVSRIMLDCYGSRLWLAVDGEHTVYDIVQYMIYSFPEEEDGMPERVVAFMRILQRQHFVEIYGNEKI